MGTELVSSLEQITGFVGLPLYDRYHFASSKSYFSDFPGMLFHAHALHRPVSIAEYAVSYCDDS